MKVVQRTDIYVGMFLIAIIGAVVTALIVTSGWGVSKWDLFVRADNVQGVAADNKIYYQGLEVGRVAGIVAKQGLRPGRLEFIIRSELLAEFAEGDSLKLPRSSALQVTSNVLGATRLDIISLGELPGMLAPNDTIELVRAPEAMQALGGLATDLKGTIQEALVTTTGTLRSFRRLADSLTLATGTARGFMRGIQPGTEQVLADAAASMQRVTRLLDSADVRSGVTLRQLDETLRQSRRVMVSADSLTRLLTALGGENQPEIRAIIENSRLLSQQMLFVMEQLSRRPARFMTGMRLPDSLTVEGRNRRPCPEGDTTCARTTP